MIGLLAMIIALAESSENADLKGTAGICVRWDGPSHVADAVVVVSSGNPVLDAVLPDTIKAMEWQRPTPPYKNGWMGITMALAGAADSLPLPKCDDLPIADR